MKRNRVVRDGTSGAYEFDDKTEHRTGLCQKGLCQKGLCQKGLCQKGLCQKGWRAKMTPDEAKKVAEAEAIIEAIKAEVSKRMVERLEALIAKLQAKMASKKA